MKYQGDYAEDATVLVTFNAFTSDDPSASATVTNFVNTDVHIHKDAGLTQRNNAAGITVSVDFDGITGSHMIVIDTSDDTVGGFWVTGADYFVRIEGATIDGATINAMVGHFSIENRFKEVDVTHIGGNSVAGNAATLTLKQLHIENSAGTALHVKSTGSNGHGIDAAGNGTGEGLKATGGATGHGIEALGGATSGQGIQAEAQTEGDGIMALGKGTGEHGIYAYGGETSGNGILAQAPTSGEGISAVAAGNFNGINADGAGSGHGINATGGATGHGLKATGGATSGAGVHASAQNNDDAGMELVKDGAGKDIDADEVDNILADTNELQGDDVPTLIAAIPDAAAIEAECVDALESLHLDHLLAVTYDPASKPGAADALLNELVESDGGVSRFTENALEEAPSGTGGDATEAKQDSIIAAVITNAAGTDVAADIIAIKAETADIVADTNELQGDDIPGTLSTNDTSLDTQIAAIKAETALIVADTDELQGDDIPGTLSTNDTSTDTQLAAIKAETALIVADTNELQGDDIPGTLSTNDTSLDTQIAAIKAETALIVADTNELQGDDIPGAISTHDGKLDTVDGIVDAIKAKTDNLPGSIPKNVELANFPFLMTDSTDHNPKDSAANLAGTIQVDGGAFGALTNAEVEIANGMYKVTITQAEMNHDTLTLRFTADDCDDRFITIITDS